MEKLKFRIAISPCPNDTYLFFAIALRKISTHFDYEFVYEDIDTLNTMASENTFPICKVSFAVYPEVCSHYQILNIGSALGYGVGPLLLSKKKMPKNEDFSNLKVLIPGEKTTAHKLFQVFYPHCKNKTFIRFDKIEQSLLREQGVLGVIIHESRFTYKKLGLHAITDLGKLWEQKNQSPIPLGGVIVQRHLEKEVKQKIVEDFKKSLLYADRNIKEGLDFIHNKAQIKDRKVVMSHIKLYVNEKTRQLGEDGKEAILKFLGQSMRDFNKIHAIFAP